MTEETNTTEEQVQEIPQVTAGDLALLVKIIDAGSERGAWKGEELGTIGAVRTKMVTIVQAVAPVQDATEESAAEEAPAKETTDTATVVDEDVPSDEPKPKRKRAAKPTAA